MAVLTRSIARGEIARFSGLANADFPCSFCARQLNGLWRSLVARLHGVQEAVGSNPASPTINQMMVYFLTFPFIRKRRNSPAKGWWVRLSSGARVRMRRELRDPFSNRRSRSLAWPAGQSRLSIRH
jgi:hypothetical protein